MKTPFLLLFLLLIPYRAQAASSLIEDYSEQALEGLPAVLNLVPTPSPETAAQNCKPQTAPETRLGKMGEVFGFETDEQESCTVHGNPPDAGSMACKFLQRNINRDSSSCAVDPGKVLTQQPKTTPKAINGKIRYIGILPHSYHYDLVKLPNGKVAVSVKIYLKTATADEKKKMRETLAKAEKLWNDNNPLADKYQFQFQVVDDPARANYSVDLKRKATRGPYDTRWSTTWDEKEVQHEVGHMMGIDDEYNQGVATLRPVYWAYHQDKYCNPASVMCDPFGVDPKPLKYHYYLIFRRGFCGGN